MLSYARLGLLCHGAAKQYLKLILNFLAGDILPVGAAQRQSRSDLVSRSARRKRPQAFAITHEQLRVSPFEHRERLSACWRAPLRERGRRSREA